MIKNLSVIEKSVVGTDFHFEPVSKHKNILSEKLKAIVEKIKQACNWLFAYFGSKDGSFFLKSIKAIASLCGIKLKQVETGYERSVRRSLNEQEMRQFVAINAMTAFVHNHDETFIQPFNVCVISVESKVTSQTREKLAELGFEFRKGSLINVELGIKLVLLQSATGQFYLGFGDAGAVKRFGRDNQLGEACSKADERVRRQVVKQLTLGNKPLMTKSSQAVSLLLHDLSQNPDLALNKENTTFIGQCYGGLLSAYCALELGHKAVTINAVSLGAHAQVKLGEKLARAKELITNVSVEGDWTQSLLVTEVADFLFSGIGFRTPGCFGKKFSIPNCHQHSIGARHDYSLDLALGNLGFAKRITPKDLTSKQALSIQESGFEHFTSIQ